MKLILSLLIFHFSFFTCFSQQVIRVNDEKARIIIEQFTAEHCKPHAVKFVQDGNGDWVTSLENFQNPRFTFSKLAPTKTKAEVETLLKTEVQKELAVQDNEYSNIADLIQLYGEIIDYVPLPEPKADSAAVEK